MELSMSDGAGAAGNGGAEGPRISFTAAYTSLENAIRNFSKEKLMYEQKIDGLKKEIYLIQESYQKLNLEQQDVMAENRRLMATHEEYDKNRLVIDTIIGSVERKHEIIAEAIESFQKMEHGMYSRYEEHEDFMYCLKFRQNKMLQWIEATKTKNQALTDVLNDLQPKYDSLMNELGAAKTLLEEKSAAFARDKAAMTENFTQQLDGLNRELNLCKDDLQREKIGCETLQSTLGDLKTQLEATSKELSDNKCLLEEKTRSWGDEKTQLENELSETKKTLEESMRELSLCKDDLQREKTGCETLQSALGDLKTQLEVTSKELNNNKCLLEENTRSFGEEKTKLESELSDTKKALEDSETEKTKLENELSDTKKTLEESMRELNLCKDDLQREKTGCETLQSSLGDLKTQLETTGKELNDNKCLLEENTRSFGDEKTKLESELSDTKKALEESENEFEHCKGELRALYQRYQDQKLAISKLCVESGVRPVTVPTKDHSKTKAKLQATPTTPKHGTPRKDPQTPVRSRTPLRSDTANHSKGILKRPKDDGLNDKSKNVSFGPTTVTDFHVSSGSEPDSSGEVYQPGKRTENIGKRMKLSDDKIDTTNEDTNKEPNEDNDVAAKPGQRRYFRNRIGADRSPIFASTP